MAWSFQWFCFKKWVVLRRMKNYFNFDRRKRIVFTILCCFGVSKTFFESTKFRRRSLSYKCRSTFTTLGALLHRENRHTTRSHLADSRRLADTVDKCWSTADIKRRVDGSIQCSAEIYTRQHSSNVWIIVKLSLRSPTHSPAPEWLASNPYGKFSIKNYEAYKKLQLAPDHRRLKID